MCFCHSSLRFHWPESPGTSSTATHASRPALLEMKDRAQLRVTTSGFVGDTRSVLIQPPLSASPDALNRSLPVGASATLELQSSQLMLRFAWSWRNTLMSLPFVSEAAQ